MRIALRHNKRPRPRRGLTLIEVLVASVLLGVGVTGLISVASLTLRNQQRTEQRATALYLAQEKIASVERLGPHVWMLGHPTEGTEQGSGAVYTWTIQLEQLAVGELFSVHVEVSWSAPGGGGTVELETWLNDYEAVAMTLESEREQPTPGAPPESSSK